jgi:hypothetical protein
MMSSNNLSSHAQPSNTLNTLHLILSIIVGVLSILAFFGIQNAATENLTQSDAGGFAAASASSLTASLDVLNNSPDSICYLYISPETSDSWGADWLGESETIAQGENRTFFMGPGLYDLRAEDCDNNVLAESHDNELDGEMEWGVE